MFYNSPKHKHNFCAIYRGAGGAGDATGDSASEALLVRELAAEVQLDANAAEAARAAAVVAQLAAELAETNAETAETNAETAETNAETAASSATSSASAASSSASAASTSATNAANSASSASTSATNAANSASSASTSATNAAASSASASASASTATTQASNASSSASSAASSASTATTQATNAANSASAAATSATNAASSATSASTSASTATTQAGIATTQATNASNSATAAATSATNASNSASAAATSATNAATSATNAANSATSAATSATNAANSFDAFDDRYLGNKASAPSLDNDGNALINGALYFDTTLNIMRVYSTTGGWQSITNALASEPIRHSVRPSLLLDFANTKTLDPRITFTRASTGTYFDANGILQTAASGVARFEHNPVTGESLGLEIEEQRTNLSLYSDNFSTDRIATRITVSVNQITSPDGTINADKLIASVDNNTHTLLRSLTLSAISHTASYYFKAAEYSRVRLYYSSFAATRADFNLADGTVAVAGTSAPTASITTVGNGWYRCSMTFTGTATSVGLGLALLDNTGANSFAGNEFNGIYVFGEQLEAGSFATSYIPTVASQVTRSADSASMTGSNFSSWFRQDEGTLYAEAFNRGVPINNNYHICYASDGSSSNFMSIRINNNTGRVHVTGITGGATQWSSSSTTIPTAGTFAKTSVAYKTNDIALTANSDTIVTDTTAVIPVVNNFYIGSTNTVTQPINGTIKKIAYYPLRLSNAELQGLTTV